MTERFAHIYSPEVQRGNGLSHDSMVEKMREQSTINHSQLYHPILTRTQEQMLFRNLRTGNDQISDFMQRPQFSQFLEEISEKDGEKWAKVLAKNETITGVIAACNYRLVGKEVRKQVRNDISQEDILGGATNGLLRAIEKFDPDKGTKFSTYALYHITAGIQKTICEYDGISHTLYKGKGKARRIQEAFTNIYDREPTREEMRQQMLVHTDFSLKRIEEILDRRTNSSLNNKFSNTDEKDIHDLHSEPSVDVEETALTHIEQRERNHIIGNAIKNHLNSEEKTILEVVFGLGKKEKQSIEEIARHFNKRTDDVLFVLNEGLIKLRGDKNIQDIGKADGFFAHNNAFAEDEKNGGPPQHGVIFEATSPLVDRIKLLRLQQYTASQMVEILGVSEGKVRRLLHKLIENGEIRSLYKIREQEKAAARSEVTEAVGKYMEEHPHTFLGKPVNQKKKSENSELDTKVKELRNKTELTYQQIAERLETTQSKVASSLKRLRATDEIFSSRLK